jgi:hypothetical protein
MCSFSIEHLHIVHVQYAYCYIYSFSYMIKWIHMAHIKILPISPACTFPGRRCMCTDVMV